MGKREEQKEWRRQQILFCSLDLFVRRGYGSTTVRDIAQKADMSVGLLFHYFPTKQAVLEAILDMAQGGVAAMTALLYLPIEPIERFQRIAEATFDAFGQSPITTSIFMLVNQTLSSDWAPEAVKHKTNSLSAMEQTIPVIVEGQRTGSIKPGDPAALSLAFWGAIQGIAEGLVCFPSIPVPNAEWLVDILRPIPSL